MIKKVKSYLLNDQYNKMVSNFSFLAIISIANKFLPLLVIPYIVRTIGVEKYGVIMFAQAAMMYFQTTTKYSFELTATKFISFNRENIEKISDYFWNVIGTQILLFLMTLLVFLAIFFSFERFYIEKEVFFFSFLMVFTTIWAPMWFFQGIEEMKYIAIFNIIARVVYTVGIFIFIQEESDYIWIPLINSLSFLIVGIYVINFVRTKYKVRFRKPSFEQMKILLKEGSHIFFSNMSVIFYTSTNTVLLGLLTNYTAVGIYSLAETIFGAYSQIIKIYSTVVYPHLARYADNVNKLYVQARKFLKLYIVILFFASGFLFLISDITIGLLFGEGHDKSVFILQILAISLLLEPLGGFFTPYLAIKSHYKVISKITFLTMIVNFILVFPMIYFYEERGLAYMFFILSVVQVYLNLKHNTELLKWRDDS